MLGIQGYPGQRGWVKWMVEELEKEAKKQGKYEEPGNDDAVKKNRKDGRRQNIFV